MPTTLRSGSRKARKPHFCQACGATIKVGETHAVSANVFDGRVYDWRECPACTEDGITSEVYDFYDMPDEGVSLDDMYEWAHEDVENPKAVRWRERRGCTPESCGYCESQANR